MTARSWIRQLFARPVTRTICKAPVRCRPALEALEDRALPAVTFSSAAHFDVGGLPESVAVGDFNGDGKADMAVAGDNVDDSGPTGIGRVSVFLGQGGTFQNAATYNAGSRPVSVAVGDFNGDGRQDLALRDRFASGLDVLMGNGDGTFQSPVRQDAEWHKRPVAMADFNGDGKQDLAEVHYFPENSVSVQLGNGDGTFQSPVHYAAGDGPWSLAAGDFNRDGKPDLAVTNVNGTSGTVSVLLGQGDGSFQSAVNYGVGVAPESVVVEDFNGDGRQDLAVDNGNSVGVLLGNGDGSFQSVVNFATGPGTNAVAVGDFNGDGKPDLVTSNYNSHDASVLLNTTAFSPSGTFTPANPYDVGDRPSAVAVGDFNRDGKPDLAVTNRKSNTVSVLLGNTDGTFASAATYATGAEPESVVVGDFNRDGKPDLATANSLGNTVSVLLGNADGSFQSAVSYGVGDKPFAVTVGDFNRDGKLDMATANAFSDTVSVLLGQGDGTFQTAASYGTGSGASAGAFPSGVAVGDFNRDGKQDLATANFGSNNVSVLLGNADGTFQNAVTYAAGAEPQSVAVGDFNGDGRLDLATANQDSDNVSVLLGNADGTFGGAATYAAGDAPRTVAVGDFNRDGKPDLATSNFLSGTVSVQLGNGDGTFGGPVPYTVGVEASGVAVGDFNRDGKPDLAVTHHTSSISVLLNNTAPTITRNLDSVTVNEGSPASNSGTFDDAEGHGTVTLAASVGTVTQNADGTWSWSYTPPDGPDGPTTVTITATDNGGLTASTTFTLTVNNVAPSLATFTVPDSAPEGSAVALSASVSDPAGSADPPSFLWTVTRPDGSTFSLSGASASFTPADDGNYGVSLTVSDGDGGTATLGGTVSVADVPPSIALSGPDSVNEGATYTLTLGAVTDPGSDAVTQYVVNWGDDTSDTYTTAGDKTHVYSGGGTRVITVDLVDEDGTHLDRANRLSVVVNVAPTDLTLSNSSIAENQPAGSTVGTFSTADANGGDTFTYTLVSGAGDADNASFTIADGVLTTAASFDFEAHSSYLIRVKSTDAGGLSTEKEFKISVGDVNEAATDIALSGSSVAEDQPPGTVVGNFSSTDPDGGDSHTYTLVSGDGDGDNASFTLEDNGNLLTAASFDFETKSSYSIRVKSTDAGGLSVEKVFTIKVNVAPRADAGGPYTVAEGASVVLSGTGSDPDASDTLSYAWDLDGDGTFETAGANPTFSAVGLDGSGTHTVTLRVTDANGLFADSTTTIQVTDVAPQVTIRGPRIWNPLGPYVLKLRFSDPGGDAVRSWTIRWGDGKVQTVRGDRVKVSHRYPLRSQSYVITAIATDDDGIRHRANKIRVRQVLL